MESVSPAQDEQMLEMESVSPAQDEQMLGTESVSPAPDKKTLQMLDVAMKKPATWHSVGDQVIVGRLLNDLQHNSRRGVVVKSNWQTAKQDKLAVRLDCGMVLKLHARNVLGTKHLQAPKIDPAIIHDFSKFCSIEPEANKGNGVRATKRMEPFTVLQDPSMVRAAQNIVLLQPAIEGRAFVSGNYEMPSTPGNEAVWRPELRRLHALLLATLPSVELSTPGPESVVVKSMCSHDTRFQGYLCTFGGCFLCGPSALVIAAGEGFRTEVWENASHRLNHTQGGHHVDFKQQMMSLQLVDVLYITNAILVGLDKIPPAETERRESWVAYVCHQAGVWCTNAFKSQYSYDQLKQCEDAAWPVEKALHQENVGQWRDWLSHFGTNDPKLGSEQEQMSKTLRARVHAVENCLSPWVEPQEPSKSSSNTYMTCGIWTECLLDGMAISSINGAKCPADTVNVAMSRYFETKEGLDPVYPRDLHSSLLVTKTIAAGQYLCMSYDGNEEMLMPDVGYFCLTDPGILWNQARGHEQVRIAISATVAVCGHLLPAHLEEYLRKCVSGESLERATA